MFRSSACARLIGHSILNVFMVVFLFATQCVIDIVGVREMINRWCGEGEWASGILDLNLISCVIGTRVDMRTRARIRWMDSDRI